MRLLRVNLDHTDRCPAADRCTGCGGQDGLGVATITTPVGVYCTTMCEACREVSNIRRVGSWTEAIGLVGAHCEHLGIDVDQMGAEIEQQQRDEVLAAQGSARC